MTEDSKLPNSKPLDETKHTELSQRVNELKARIQADYPSLELPDVYVRESGSYIQKASSAIGTVNSSVNDGLGNMFPSMRDGLKKQEEKAVSILQMTTANASVGRSRFADHDSITINSSLLSLLTPEEGAAAIAHEYGHYAKGHNNKINYSLSFPRMYNKMGNDETEADLFAEHYGYGKPLISMFEKVGKQVDAHPVLSILKHVDYHPPIKQRIEAIEHASEGHLCELDTPNCPNVPKEPTISK